MPRSAEAERVTSEVGQKRKCPGSRGTSGLPSGADIVSLRQHVRLVPQPDSCIAARKALFNHFVGASEQRGRDLHPELPCSFLVHDQLKFGGALHG